MQKFQLVSQFTASPTQANASDAIVNNLINNVRDQTLLGVTGSGKTFTMALVIEKTNRPAIILAPNKTLVAQLYQEFKSFFPYNAVEYFVSYYDYYQPEAYIARTDTYIEKDAMINEQIDRLRHSATRSLITRNDVIVVASVSAIYGIGDRELYEEITEYIRSGQQLRMQDLISKLVVLQYLNKTDFKRGSFRVKGDILDIFPSHYENVGWKLSFFGNKLESIWEFDVLTGEKFAKLDQIMIFANTHYITPQNHIKNMVTLMEQEMEERVEFFIKNQRIVEAERIKQRVNYDIEMLLLTGHCKGIENYSRYLTMRPAGFPPPTLFEYMPKDFLVFVDESHVMLSQIGGMYSADRARKLNLINYGFRLPSAVDNRPLMFEEYDKLRGQTVYISATPSELELNLSGEHVVEQIIRPTGLIDPVCEIRKTETQVLDLVNEAKKECYQHLRILVTTLTKKMAENLYEYLVDAGLSAYYLHSDIDTLERIEIIDKLRAGVINILVGVNLLREGLDIPECGLVAILDADKEGFLRSATSLIQTIGRAARNAEGRVILYADVITKSLKKALDETNRRREIQIEYNKQHGITPKTIVKERHNIQKMFSLDKKENKELELDKKFKTIEEAIRFYKKKMLKFAADQKFEEAKILRDRIKELENMSLE